MDCFFPIFLRNFNLEKECETKTFLIVHDLFHISCDIRKKKNRVRKVYLQKQFSPVLGTRKVEINSGFPHIGVVNLIETADTAYTNYVLYELRLLYKVLLIDFRFIYYVFTLKTVN